MYASKIFALGHGDTLAARLDLDAQPLAVECHVRIGVGTLRIVSRSTTLVGTATDDGLPEGSTLSYAWTVVDGPAGVTIASPGSLSTGVTFTFEGTYTFQLAATDGEKVGTSLTTVRVDAAPPPPEPGRRTSRRW